MTLVHYLGDHTCATDFPHGNVAHLNQPHVRTCPSVLRALSSTDVPSNVYKNEIGKNDCDPQLLPVLKPRNTSQVSYVQAKERKKYRLTHDALYNLHELSYDLDGFVAKITTFPDLEVICGLNVMINEVDKLLPMSTQTPQLLSYDTTFQLGDFYLSPLLFRHVAFSPSPVLPALFLIHERKLQTTHEEFMKHVSKVIPSLTNSQLKIPIVTDDEAGICKAIDLHLPKLSRLRCWNHIINAAKFWLRKHGALSSEIPVYVSHMRDLFHQPNEEAYTKQLQVLEGIWSRPFSDYYMAEIHPEVRDTNACM